MKREWEGGREGGKEDNGRRKKMRDKGSRDNVTHILVF